MTLERPELDSQGQIVPATGASYWSIIAQCTQVRVKPDILKNSKEIFLLAVFKRNFVHK
jgi:hypothetical protein